MARLHLFSLGATRTQYFEQPPFFVPAAVIVDSIISEALRRAGQMALRNIDKEGTDLIRLCLD